jgi:hypothetical protein
MFCFSIILAKMNLLLNFLNILDLRKIEYLDLSKINL